MEPVSRRTDVSTEELLAEIEQLRADNARLRADRTLLQRRMAEVAPALALSVLTALSGKRDQPGRGPAAAQATAASSMAEVLEAMGALTGAERIRLVALGSGSASGAGEAGAGGEAGADAAEWAAPDAVAAPLPGTLPADIAARLGRGEPVLVCPGEPPPPGLEAACRGRADGGQSALAMVPVRAAGPGAGASEAALCLAWRDPAASAGTDPALLEVLGELMLHMLACHRVARVQRRRLRYLEDTMRVYAAMEGHQDLDAMLGAAVATLREVFDCGRAFVIHPCRPNASAVRVAAVSEAAPRGDAMARGREIDVDEELAGGFSAALVADRPMTFGPGNERPLVSLSTSMGASAEMWLVLRVRMGEPWLLGLHAQGAPRVWTDEEQRLCAEVGRRLADEIGTFLSFQSSRANEDRFRSLLAAIPDLMFVFDADGYILEVFPLEHELLLHAPEQVLGQNVFDVLPPPVAQAAQYGVDRSLATGELQHVEYALDLPEGKRWFSARMAQFGGGDKPRVICVSRDITARRSLEEQLLQAQKMESIGRLAGGVSHDFNNLLTAVMSHAELAMEDVADDAPVRQDLALIYDAASRGAALTRQLLTFARKQVISPQIVNLNELLLRVDTLLRRLIGADIELVTVPDPALGVVEVDPVQFEQVLVNLAINARDAMPGGGKLTFETANRALGAEDVSAHPGLFPGEYVVLRVSDTGVGMDEETMSHVFEPFFTTKEVGKGTGLGLATCYGIVKQGGGDLWVQSRLGQGTVFEVVLPRAEGPVDVLDESEESFTPRSGHERVLVVEDEPTVRAGAVRTLRRYGYEVLEAANGDEALALGPEVLTSLDLLLTDVVMPRMSGRQLAEQVHLLKPELRVLFVSGYTDDAVMRLPSRDQGVAFLQKPFTPILLARKVRELLDAPAAPQDAGDPAVSH